MKTTTAAIIDYINDIRAQNDATVVAADCFTFILKTGLVLTYTNADMPIQLNGYLFLANSVLVDGLRYKCTLGLDVDQQQVTISAKARDTVGNIPFLQALRNGAFDGAEIQRERAFLNSWSPSDCASPIGSVILFKGRIGSIDSIGRTSAQVTVNSDLVLLDVEMPRNVYSPACQHVHYDTGCGLVKSAFGVPGVVATDSTNSVINWAGATADFKQGTLIFSPGINNGVSVNIKDASTGVSLTLSYPLINAPSTGDVFMAFWGCDHTKATCKTKFNNLSNFRGFPYIPPPTYSV